MKTDVLAEQIVFRRHRMRKIKRIFRHILLSVITVVIFVAVYFVFHRLQLFRVERFEVVGLLKQRSIADVIQSSEVRFHHPLFQVSLREVRENILKDPWIQNVTVRHVPPNVLWIHVTEYTPVALCLLDRLYFVSSDGVLYKPVEMGEIADLPVLTGFDRKKPAFIGEALLLVRRFETEFQDGYLGVAELHYDAHTGFSLVTLQSPMLLQLGFNDFTAKLARFSQLLAFARDHKRTLKWVDLNYKEKVFVKWKQI